MWYHTPWCAGCDFLVPHREGIRQAKKGPAFFIFSFTQAEKAVYLEQYLHQRNIFLVENCEKHQVR
jgi:hypothetical protein